MAAGSGHGNSEQEAALGAIMEPELSGRVAAGARSVREIRNPAIPRFHLRQRGPSGGQRAWRKRSFPLSHGRSEVLKGHRRETQVQRGEGGGGVGLGVTPPGQAGCPPGAPTGAVFLPVGWLSACAEVTTYHSPREAGAHLSSPVLCTWMGAPCMVGAQGPPGRGWLSPLRAG